MRGKVVLLCLEGAWVDGMLGGRLVGWDMDFGVTFTFLLRTIIICKKIERLCNGDFVRFSSCSFPRRV